MARGFESSASTTLDSAAAAQAIKTALDGAIVVGRRLAVDFSGKARMP